MRSSRLAAPSSKFWLNRTNSPRQELTETAEGAAPQVNPAVYGVDGVLRAGLGSTADEVTVTVPVDLGPTPIAFVEGNRLFRVRRGLTPLLEFIFYDLQHVRTLSSLLPAGRRVECTPILRIEIKAAVGEIVTLVAQGKIGNLLIPQRHGQTGPVVERGILNLVAQDTAVASVKTQCETSPRQPSLIVTTNESRARGVSALITASSVVVRLFQQQADQADGMHDFFPAAPWPDYRHHHWSWRWCWPEDRHNIRSERGPGRRRQDHRPDRHSQPDRDLWPSHGLPCRYVQTGPGPYGP